MSVLEVVSPLIGIRLLSNWLSTIVLGFLSNLVGKIANPLGFSTQKNLIGFQSFQQASRQWSAKTKAITTVVVTACLVVALPIIGVRNGHEYVAMGALGLLLGLAASYPIMEFFGKKIQAGIAAFLGGLSLSSIQSQEAAVRSFVQDQARSITNFFLNAPTSDTLSRWQTIDKSVILCFWIFILTLIVVVFVQAYFSWNETTVQVNAFPNGASLVVDNLPAVSTPATLRLKSGSHNLSVSSAGLRDWKAAIDVARESEVSLSMTLQP
jgi:hypothetical protein